MIAQIVLIAVITYCDSEASVSKRDEEDIVCLWGDSLCCENTVCVRVVVAYKGINLHCRAAFIWSAMDQ